MFFFFCFFFLLISANTARNILWRRKNTAHIRVGGETEAHSKGRSVQTNLGNETTRDEKHGSPVHNPTRSNTITRLLSSEWTGVALPNRYPNAYNRNEIATNNDTKNNSMSRIPSVHKRVQFKTTKEQRTKKRRKYCGKGVR